jgi:hypothetical protein
MKLAIGLLCCFTAFSFAQDTPPPQQPPPTAPGTPPTPKPRVELPPQPQGQPSKAPPPERDTGGDYLSIMPFYWQTPNALHLRKSADSTATQEGYLNIPSNKNYAYGGILTIPTSHENSLQFTYWRKQDHGNSVLAVDSSFAGDVFSAGDFLNSHYTMQYMKLSWNYLTYPYPSAGAKFRVKTLWEVQYVTVNTTIDAPFDANSTTTEVRKSVILPALGMGIEYHPAKHVLLELKGSGFGIPHHADLYDVEGNIVVRASRLEFVLGGQVFHFKTSPHGDNYYFATLYGPYAGLRYIFK